MSPVQSNTQEGLIVTTAGADLSAKVGYLANKNSSDVAVLAGAGERALYIIEDGAILGKNVTLRPMHPNRNVRVPAAGPIACAAEVQSDGAGKIVAASSGAWVLGVTEEAIVTGQYGLFRPALYVKA